MDDFLTSLYQEEQEKVAAEDMERFFSGISKEELEDFVGVEKAAVAGPPEPEMPSSLPANELDARMKAVDEYAQKAHEGKNPPTVAESKETNSISYQGKSKVEPKEKKAYIGVSIPLNRPSLNPDVAAEQGKRTGAGLGGILGGAAGLVGGAASAPLRLPGERVGKGLKGALGRGRVRGALGAALGAGAGILAGRQLGASQGRKASERRRESLLADAREKAKMIQQLKSEGIGKKAEVIVRSMELAKVLPESMQKAAMVVTGRQLAELTKEAKKESYSVKPSFFSGHKGQRRALTGGDAKTGRKLFLDPQVIGESSIQEFKTGLKGAAIGAPTGAGLGALAARIARGRRNIPLGAGAALGAVLGSSIGMGSGKAVGATKAKRDFLAKKGIKMTGTGFGRGLYTPSAAKKYLTKEERAKATRV
jgi:hypothetical protein